MTTKIEWTERTWNPTVGCSKVSPGCNNCYAEKMSIRLQAMGIKAYKNGFDINLLPERLEEPLTRTKPTMYFVNSMSDLFHESIPFDYIKKVFNTIEQTPHHTFQILTKRSSRSMEYFKNYVPPANAWIGVTVEDKKHGLTRLDQLRNISAYIRFLSIEPLLEDLGILDLRGINWVIVGGESGHNARQMHKAWVISIKQQCDEQHIPFFFKQWGMYGEDGIKRQKKLNGRLLNGRIYNGMPKVLIG